MVFERLKNKTILVTRAADSVVVLLRLLHECGAASVVVPMIHIADPVSWMECDHAAGQLKKYDGVIFTSKNAVRKFVGRIAAVNGNALAALRSTSVFAVGGQTAAALKDFGIETTEFPESASAQALTELLSRRHVAGKRFLFPKSNIARKKLPEVLRSLHAIVDELVVYRTLSPSPSDIESYKKELSGQTIDAVLFFSPSAVENFAQTLGVGSINNAVAAVIGETTAQAARAIGLRVSVIPSEANAEMLVASLDKYFQSQMAFNPKT